MTECIPDFHVSAISRVSVDGFSPNFCHWCISGQRCPDYVFGSKGQSSRSRHPGRGTQHSTLPLSATFSSLLCISDNRVSLERRKIYGCARFWPGSGIHPFLANLAPAKFSAAFPYLADIDIAAVHRDYSSCCLVKLSSLSSLLSERRRYCDAWCHTGTVCVSTEPCLHAMLVSVAKVMRCVQCSLL